MDVGIENQRRALKLFSSYKNRQTLVEQVEKLSNGDDVSETAVDSLITLLRCEAKQLGTTFPSHATQFVTEAVSYLVNLNTSRTFLLKVICKLGALGVLTGSEIQQKFNDFPFVVPVDVLYECESLGMASTLLYFQSCSENNKKATALFRHLVETACQTGGEKNHAALAAFVATLVEFAHGSMPPEVQPGVTGKALNAAVMILKNLTRKVWDYLWENAECSVGLYELSAQTTGSGSATHLKLPAYQKCCLEQLGYLFSYKPDVKPSTVITSQVEWTYFKTPKNVVLFVTQLLLPLEPQAVVDKIDDILCRCEVNWKTLLVIVSVVHVCYSLGTKLLKVLIASLLHRALEKAREDLLLAALLLARQITCENHYANYGLWFSTITTSSTNPKHFAFLVEYLSGIARYDTAPVLRAQLGNPPHIPPGERCRQLWSDYVALIRTRLVDLGPTTQQVLTDQVLVDDVVEKEVDQAVADYGRTQRVPNNVLQMAIFRKPHFLHKFLPMLLQPRPMPRPPDARLHLVEELKKSGKLPAPTYLEYITACQSISNKLMDGIPLADDEMEWQATDPMAEFQTHLEELVAGPSGASGADRLERAAKTLRKLIRPAKDEILVVDIGPPFVQEELRKDRTSLKVLECWVAALKESIHNEGRWPQWGAPSFVQLCEHPRLVRSLCLLVCNYVSSGDRDPHSVHCYGSLIHLMEQHADLLLPARRGAATASFVDALAGDWKLRRAESMRFGLSLFRRILRQAGPSTGGESAFLRRIGQLYHWLARRVRSSDLHYDECRPDLDLMADSAYRIGSFKLSLSEWLQLEVEVDPDGDLLSWTERCGHLQRVVGDDYAAEAPGDGLARAVWRSIVDRAVVKPAGDETVDRPADCSQDLLVLLQSLLFDRPASKTSPDPQRNREPLERPWLLDFWLEVDASAASDSTLWSLAGALSPRLLSPGTEAQVQQLAALVQDRWRHSLVQGACLPWNVMDHLERALGRQRLQRGLELHLPCLEFARHLHQVLDAPFPVVFDPPFSL